MRFFGWFRSPEEVPNLVTESAMIEGEALHQVIAGLEQVNEGMEVLVQSNPRMSLWVDRTERPYRLQLCDWSDSYPRVVAGDR
jgi:hypothetical protein